MQFPLSSLWSFQKLINRFVWRIFACIVLLSGLSCSEERAAIRPNVAIIFIDDMGYGDLGCYGNSIVPTPYIDAIANQGTKFNQFYVNSPICSPSRVALNTGRYPMRYQIHSYIASSQQNAKRAMANYLNPEAPTLAKTLKQAGYATGHFGKWHMGGGRDLGEVPFPTEYGFDQSLVSFEGIGNRILFPNDKLSKQSAALGKGEIIWAEKHQSTRIYVDHALDFIQASGEQPFYINLCPNDVHDPFLPDSVNWAAWSEVTENPFEQKFFAVLQEMDGQIGRFVATLDSLGKLDNTLIILASDNGPTDWPYYYTAKRYPEGYEGAHYPPGFTGGLFGRKWSLYEGGIREPLIVSWKGHIPRGETDSTTVMAAMDLFPSICSLLELEYPDTLDGTDKSQALLGTPLEKVPPIMWEYASNPGGSIQPGNKNFRSPSLAIRAGDWKLLMNADGSSAQLFDLKMDPAEKNNQAADKPTIVRELAAKVIEWRKSMPVEMPIN